MPALSRATCDVGQRLQVRALVAADAQTYRALRLAGIAEMPAAFFTSHAAEAGLPLAVIEKRLLHTRFQRIFGAFDGGELIGMTSFKREPIAVLHDRANLWGVYVRIDARRQGAARAMLRAALAHARTFPELTQVALKVHNDNTGAIALYRSLGFTAAEALPQNETGMLLRL